MLTHAFVSAYPDGSDPNRFQPSHWNAEHAFSGGAHGGLIYRDTGAAGGASWLAPGSAGAVLMGQPAGPPTWSAVLPTLRFTDSLAIGDGAAAAEAGFVCEVGPVIPVYGGTSKYLGLFRNPTDGEMWTRFRAGATADQRRYLSFEHYDGTQDWLIGANALDDWILYETDSAVHRFLATGPTTGGYTCLNARGTNAVRVGYMGTPATLTGTGGLEVYGGGLTQPLLGKITSQGWVLPAGSKLFPDGGGNTYLQEVSSDYLALAVGATVVQEWRNDTGTPFSKFPVDLYLAATKKLYFTAGATVWAVQSSTNVLDLYTASTLALRLTAAQELQFGNAIVALGGGAAATLGTIGGSGPTGAVQVGWWQVRDKDGNAGWVPLFK